MSYTSEQFAYYFPNGLVAIDLETTGLSPITDRIIEIAAIKLMPDGQVETYCELINPQIKIPEFSIAIHHITDQMVQNSKTIEQALPTFIKFISDLPIVAHNASFDLGFLIQIFSQEKLSLPYVDVYDSCKFARRLVKGVANHRLETLVNHFKIVQKTKHRALDDADAALKVFLGCLNLPNLDLVEECLKKSVIYNLSIFKNGADYFIPDHLKGLLNYLSGQKVIEIDYNGGSLKGKYRPIRPIGFLPLPTGMVLHAECMISGQNKSFALRKITSFRLPPE